ncbi:MAG: hypothetical protein AB1Z67_05000 [Candidatus Limnocylindrales bacterium]
MNRPQVLPRLAVTALGLAVGVLTPLGPALGQDAATNLTRPDPAAAATDAARTVDDAPPAPPEVLDLVALADEVVAVLERMPAGEWVVADVAAAIDGDPAVAFAFVRDHIGFDPYVGSLRSPQGTLAARAGNGLDRARLLQALLGPEITSRFASGTLADTTPIVDRALTGVSEPLPGPSVTEVMPFAVEAMANRARRDHALLIEALGDDYATLGAADAGDIEVTIAADHAWLQLRQDDGTWLDLDPTLADAEPGDTLATAEATFEELPPETRHELTFRLIAEPMTDDGPTSEIVLDETIPADVAADRDIWLLFAPANPSVGGALAGALGESDGWVPVLYLQGDTRAGSSFSLGADSGEGGGTVLDDALGGLGGLGGGEAAGGDAAPPGLTELRLELTSTGPGLEPRIVERVLLGEPTDGGLPAALSGGHHILVSNGGFDLRRLAVARGAITVMAADVLANPELASEYRLIDQLLPWAVADRTLAAVSEHVITPGIGRAGEARAYVGRPRAWIVSHGIDVEDETFSGTVDLALDAISLVSSPAMTPAEVAHERLWYGVLQTALETEAARKRVRRSGSDAELSSVSIDTAGTLERLGETALDAGSGALSEALDDGDIALGASYATTGSFWRVDPRTGATTSVQEPGIRPSNYGGSYPGGGGGYYQINADLSSRRLNAPQRGPNSGGGLEYQIVQGAGTIIALGGAFLAGWLVGRAFVNALDWVYSE